MQNTSWKRMLCLLMSVAMLMSCCPVTALAADEEESVVEETELPAGEAEEVPTAEPEPVAEGEGEDEEVFYGEAAPIGEEDGEEAPAAKDPNDPVRVKFVCTPEELTLTVTDMDGRVIDPEEDGSYLLLPGKYFYTAFCEGYLSAENVPFAVEGESEIAVTLCSAEEPIEVGAAVLGTIMSTSGGSTIVASGDCGANLTWALDNEGVLTISGTGEMADYADDLSAPWYEYRKDITKAVIGTGVTSIGDCAFYDCYALTDVTIPKGVTSIGDSAFLYCSALADVALPDTVTSIGANAFYACRALRGINLPDDLSFLGEAAFGSCSALQSIAIPASVTSIDANTFANCSALTGMTVASGNPVYHSSGNCIIETDSKTLVIGCNGSVIPDDGSVTSIGSGAFKGSGLTSVIIPLSVTSIGGKAFSTCHYLTDVYYPGSPQQWDAITIGDGNGALDNAKRHYGLAGTGKCGENVTWVLTNNGLLTISGTGDMADFESYAPWADMFVKKAVVEESVTGVGNYTFAFLPTLNEVTLPSTLTRIGDAAFNGCSALKTVAIPDGVTRIGYSAFCDCDSFTTVALPSALETIGENAFCMCNELTTLAIPKSVTHIGDYCFMSCPKLSSLTVEKGSTAFRISDGCLIDLANEAVIYGWGQCVIPDDGSVTAIADGAFINNRVLKGITIPDGVTRIGNYAFQNCYALTDVTVGEGLKSIGQDAFASCEALGSITIPSTVEFIEYGAFSRCLALADVYFIGTEEQLIILLDHISVGDNDCLFSAVIHYAYSASGECGEDLTWTLTPEGVLTIKGTGAMDNWDSNNTAPWAYFYVTEIVIGDGVTSIGNEAFPFLTELRRVTVPDSVTSIGDKAFFVCTKLTDIDLPDGVTRIGNRAFEVCEALTELDLPSALESIGNYAFNGCRALTEITIPKNVQHMGISVFSLCTALRAIRVEPENTAFRSVDGCLIDISEKALIAGWGKAVIPDDGSVTSIADNAFCGDRALTNITIPKGVKSIGAGAFDDCINLCSVTISEGVKTIGNSAFRGCRNLSDVTLPNTLTEIDIYAFQSCGKLTAIVLPASLKTIGEGAFTSYTTLKSAAYLDTAEKWAQVTGDGKTQLENLCNITFLPPAASVTVTLSDGSSVPTEVDMQAVPKLSLAAALTPASCKSGVAWTSSDENIATVDKNGVVRFLSVGSVTLTATAEDGNAVSGSVTINVRFAEEAAVLTAVTNVPTDGIPVGGTASVSVFGADKGSAIDPSKLRFVSDNPAVAAVDENGVITAKAPGNASITVSFAGNDPLGRSVCVFVSVTPAVTASGWKVTDALGIESTDSTLNLNVDAAARTFTLEVTDDTGSVLPSKDYNFTTSDGKVAKVAKAKDGSITLTIPKNASGACTVTAKPTDKTLSGAALTLSVFVRDYAPRLANAKLTLNSYDVRGVSVGLTPSYENEIEGITIYEKSGKSDWVTSAQLVADYDEASDTLTVSTVGGAAIANRSITAKLAIDGSITDCEVPITVVIKNTLPALTVKQTRKLNTFLTDDYGTLTFSAKNAEIENAEFEIDGFNANYVDGELILRRNGAAPAKKGTLLVYFAGYNIPVSKTVSFTAVNTKPGLTATPASGTVNGRTGGEVSFTVYNKTDKCDVDLSGCTVTADKGFARISGNRVYLSADSSMLAVTKKTAGKVTLTVENPDWTAPLKVTYTLTVQPPAAPPAAKLKTSTLTLNSLYPTVSASTLMTLDQTGRSVEGTFTCAKTDKIAVTLEGDQVVARLLDPSVPNGSYPFVGKLTADGDAMKDVKLTVKVVNTAAAATGAASGKLDAIRRGTTAITYAVTLKNTTAEITGVTAKKPTAQLSATVVDGSGKFDVTLGAPNAKGLPTVVLKLKSGESYDTKLTYKLRFVLSVEGVGTVTTPDVTVKVPQSALKLSSVAAQTVYQSQAKTRTVAYTLTLTSPADAKIGKIEKGSGLNALFARTLADSQSTVSWEIAPDGRSAVVYVTVSDTSRLTAGKSYAIPLVITPEGCAEHGSVTKLNLSLKALK